MVEDGKSARWSPRSTPASSKQERKKRNTQTHRGPSSPVRGKRTTRSSIRFRMRMLRRFDRPQPIETAMSQSREARPGTRQTRRLFALSASPTPNADPRGALPRRFDKAGSKSLLLCLFFPRSCFPPFRLLPWKLAAQTVDATAVRTMLVRWQWPIRPVDAGTAFLHLLPHFFL